MTIYQAIELLKSYNGPLGLELHAGASEELINKVEQVYNITLPDDFKILYRFTNGFGTVEDMFSFIPLDEVIDNHSRKNKEPHYIAEYMIYCDMWQLEINSENCNDYKIIKEADGNKLLLTQSLAEFIDRVLKGSVFEPGGLFDWQEETELQPIYTTRVETVRYLMAVFHHGLIHGLVSKAEVTAWADELVMRENEPEDFFIDLSLSHDKNDMISLLSTISLPKDDVTARAILGLLYHRLSNDKIDVYEATSVMNNSIFRDALLPEEMQFVYEFTDEIRIIDDLVYTSRLKKDVLQFLSGYQNFELSNYKYWHGLSYQIEFKYPQKKGETPRVQKTSVIKLWMINVFVYTLAAVSLLVVIDNCILNNVDPVRKIGSDFIQVALLFLTFFAAYQLLKFLLWIGRKLVLVFRKIFS